MQGNLPPEAQEKLEELQDLGIAVLQTVLA
jgi:hypothetical protein